MTRSHLFTSACLVALGLFLTACGGSDRRQSRDEAVTSVSETVSDAPSSSEAPAASESASDANATAPAPPSDAVARLTPDPQGLDPDEVAAAGDTRRRSQSDQQP